MPFCHEELKGWFLENRRELPWRGNPSPYAVWVSEVMLQQTQASVVQGYFIRWMERFPTIGALAAAPLEEVIKLWEGLGYYSRARYLHAGAQWLTLHNRGELPSTYEELIQIKGLGRYTVGAILSFAFRKKRAAVDGNVTRVLSRYFALTTDVWAVAEEILPEEEPWLVVEGLIELGALVCKKEPLCASCPLNATCKAYRLGAQREFPKPKKRAALTLLRRSVFVLLYQGSFLVKKGEKGAIMADLYEFPFVEEGEEPAFLKGAQFIKKLPAAEHHFTRFKVCLRPTLWRVQTPLEGYEQVPYAEIGRLPFSAGHRKVLQHVQGEHAHFTH